jgi:hypothetical protein
MTKLCLRLVADDRDYVRNFRDRITAGLVRPVPAYDHRLIGGHRVHLHLNHNLTLVRARRRRPPPSTLRFCNSAWET